LVIIGAGGLGLMAVQIAKSITNSKILIVDVDNEKLKEAKRLGADHIINSVETDPIKNVKDLSGGQGCEIVIDFVNNSKTAPVSY
jgi:propanol-preferring alcohol dehydrogenase